MQDRVSIYPGRVKLVPVAGQENTYDMVRADSPTQEGTPLNKDSLLKDATAALYGLGTDAVPDDVLTLLSRFNGGMGNEYLWAKYRNTQLPKIVESTTVSKVAMFRRVGASTFTVQYADSVKMSGDSVVLVNPTTISGRISDYASSYAAQTVGKYVVSAENGKVYKIDGVATEWYGNYIGQPGYLVSVEYETVSAVVGYVNSPDSNAYPVDDGYTYQALGQLGAKAHVATGSYTGTGKYGERNPNILTFNFIPKYIAIYYIGVDYDATPIKTELMQGMYGVFNKHSIFSVTYYDADNENTGVISAWGTTVKFYSDYNHQPNKQGDTYKYLAIG